MELVLVILCHPATCRLAMRPELVRATGLLRRNTPEAVEEAIGLLQNTVYSFSMKICGHPEDAEDTMQEMLFRCLEHLAKMQDPQELAVWLYSHQKRVLAHPTQDCPHPCEHALARRVDAER
jgi:RNA polymerase sigma-70 factor (ECF subfamily)